MSQTRIPLKPGETYHIWTHANGDDNLFGEEDNYNYFLTKYSHYIYPVTDTFAYCLMPNHLHLMVRIQSKKDVFKFLKTKLPTLQGFQTLGGFSRAISLQFSHLFNGYTQAYNKKYNRKGSLFIPNFKRKLIDSDEYFTQLIIYIHNNPIHHGFVKDINNWPHSSWFAYQRDKPTKIKKEEALNWFGGIGNFDTAHENVNSGIMSSLFENG